MASADAAATAFVDDSKQFSVEMDAVGGGRRAVPITTDDVTVDLQEVLDAQVFIDWVATVDKDELLFILEVEVQSVDMFGARIGFIKFKSRAQVNIGGDEGVVEVPGIVFMRGGAVGVLVILECDGEEHTIMTYQARVPVGIHNLPEVPAGMLDGSGNFRGVAADEIAEECDIVISEDELVDLTELSYGDKWKGMLPSAGGCDEFIRLYVFRREVEREVLSELEGRLTGLRSEGERIKLHIVPLQEAWRLSPDAKLLSCLTLYDKLKAEGKLPGPQLNIAPVGVHELAQTNQSIEEGDETEGIHAQSLSPTGATKPLTKLGEMNERMASSNDSSSTVASSPGRSSRGGLSPASAREEGEKNDEFCIKNEKSCIKNEEFCTKKDEFCRATLRSVSNRQQKDELADDDEAAF